MRVCKPGVVWVRIGIGDDGVWVFGSKLGMRGKMEKCEEMRVMI